MDLMMTFIYVLGALLIGFLLGITTENVYKVNQVRIYQDRLHRSEQEKEALRKQLNSKPQTVEILDRRSVQAENLFKPF